MNKFSSKRAGRQEHIFSSLSSGDCTWWTSSHRGEPAARNTFFHQFHQEIAHDGLVLIKESRPPGTHFFFSFIRRLHVMDELSSRRAGRLEHIFSIVSSGDCTWWTSSHQGEPWSDHVIWGPMRGLKNDLRANERPRTKLHGEGTDRQTDISRPEHCNY